MRRKKLTSLQNKILEKLHEAWQAYREFRRSPGAALGPQPNQRFGDRPTGFVADDALIGFARSIAKYGRATSDLLRRELVEARIEPRIHAITKKGYGHSWLAL